MTSKFCVGFGFLDMGVAETLQNTPAKLMRQIHISKNIILSVVLESIYWKIESKLTKVW